MILVLMLAAAGVTFCVTYRELGGRQASVPASAKTEEIAQYLDYFFIDDYDEGRLADGAAAGMIAATGMSGAIISAQKTMQDMKSR